MRSRHFHPEWGYATPASPGLRAVGIALVAIAIGTVAGNCVVIELITASGVNSSISTHDTLFIAAAPTVKRPAASPDPGISVPASVSGFPQPEPAGLSGSQIPDQATAALPEVTHVEVSAPAKKHITKKHHASNRCRNYRIGRKRRLGPTFISAG